jgi:predicted nucleotidyltransferase
MDTLRRRLNLTLTTSEGDIDLLGEVTGGGAYDNLLPDSEIVSLFGLPCRCVTLETLIRLKRAAGRPRDLDAIAELEALRDERGR